MNKRDYEKNIKTIKTYLKQVIIKNIDKIEDDSYVEHHVLNALKRIGYYITDSGSELEDKNNPFLVALYLYGYLTTYKLLLEHNAPNFSLNSDIKFENLLKSLVDLSKSMYNNKYNELKWEE